MNNNLVHFVWLGGDLPDAHAAELKRFISLNPNLHVRLWDAVPDGMPRDLADVVHHAAPMLCQKADVIRVWLLAEYGGMYFDTDIAWMASVEPLRKRSGLWATRTHQDISNFAMGLSSGYGLSGAGGGRSLLEAYRQLILEKADRRAYHDRACYGPRCLAELASQGLEVLPRACFDAVSSHRRRLAIWNAQPEERRIMVERWADIPLGDNLIGIHAGLDSRR